MRILVATDAWRPQINGVVRSLEMLGKSAADFGVEIDFLTPQEFRTFPMPGYPEIPLSLAFPSYIRRRINTGFDHIHIATEGPIGQVTRTVCLKDKICFTTSFHTLFPEYIHARCGLPISLSYGVLRRFHNAGAGVMVSTPTLARNLNDRGFARLLQWSRGVDHDLFTPEKEVDLGIPKPIFLYAGRLAVEKNLESFLSLELPGSKIVVGDGPARAHLMKLFPDTIFLGSKTSDELAPIYASSDVFVFPSRTDTFGMVLLEALSSGLPIAAFPVMGPIDVIGKSEAGVMDDDLRVAALEALKISRECARMHALKYSWRNCAMQFLDNVAHARGVVQLRAGGIDSWLKQSENNKLIKSGPVTYG